MVDNVALEEARRRKERTNTELAGAGGRVRLIVLAAEWSAETAQFLGALAKARAQEAPIILQLCAGAAWLRRWSSLLERRPAPAAGDVVPSLSEVLREATFM